MPSANQMPHDSQSDNKSSKPVFKDCRVRGGTAVIDVELERVGGIIRAICRGMNLICNQSVTSLE